MLPTLKPGQDILSFNWAYLGNKPKIGDIVVMRLDGKEIVKRIQKVDGRKIFIEGDNPLQSTDSRQIGPIDISQITGKVVYTSSQVDCLNCNSAMVGIAGRKDAFCQNCGFKLTCCGEPQ